MFQIRKYGISEEAEWDKFIDEKSVNGTFLQSRRFLNYHPEGKFMDDSLMIYNEKGNLCALVPACTIYEGDIKIFYSHKGSTFGGIIIDKKHYRAKYLLSMVEEILQYIKEDGYREIYIKHPSDIFCRERMDLFEYAFQHYGFYEYKELSTYIDYTNYKEDILSNFSQGKRTNVHNCKKNGLYIKSLETDEEIEQFYFILCGNLSKYNAKPVHTVDELIEFKNKRLKKECEFFGCYLDCKMIAGAMMFYFENAQTAHAQYLAADLRYNQLSPMGFLYYSLIKGMKMQGYRKLSWGIATEDCGKYLNMGLITSKEDFGSNYCNNLTYYYKF